MASQKIIIDTDPGIDDVLAISLALCNPKELDVVLMTTTHGNVDVNACTKNLVALMNIMQQENETRERLGLYKLPFRKPVIAVGADRPIIKAHGHGDIPDESDIEGYHGFDGLNGTHSRNPMLVAENFLDSFLSEAAAPTSTEPYIPSRLPAHDEILLQLRKHESKSITLVALGPCTNLALALAKDPKTFHRVQKVVIMGGAVRHAGNMTPCAEFNIYGDPDAAQQIFNLSSPSKSGTALGRIPICLVPLDVTTYHTLAQDTFAHYVSPLVRSGRPLAKLLSEIFAVSFEKIIRYSGKPLSPCHDPLTIYALLHPELMTWETLDVRVEASGSWTRGQTIVDARGIPRWKPGEVGVIRDNGNWLHGDAGNQVDVLVGSGGDPSHFGLTLLKGIFESSV